MPAPTAVPTTDATSPQSGFVPARQAPELFERQRKLNAAKKPAYIPRAIKEQSAKSRVYIFNVGPKRLEGSGASYGTIMIQACPEGKEYSEPYVCEGLPHEYYNKEGSTLDVQFHGDGEMEDPGFDFACQVIGGYTKPDGQWEGKFLSVTNSLERFGVGISRTWPPSKEDVVLARKKMFAEYAQLVQQANEAHAIGRFSAVATPDHYIAARALGKTAAECRWLEFTADIERRSLCPKCRKPYDEGTVEHDCGFILDKKQYDKWMAEGLIANK